MPVTLSLHFTIDIHIIYRTTNFSRTFEVFTSNNCVFSFSYLQFWIENILKISLITFLILIMLIGNSQGICFHSSRIVNTAWGKFHAQYRVRTLHIQVQQKHNFSTEKWFCIILIYIQV